MHNRECRRPTLSCATETRAHKIWSRSSVKSMSRLIKSRNLEPVIAAAHKWIRNCLIEDSSVFSNSSLWTAENIEEVRDAFVEHPDESKDSFSNKLRRQMEPASSAAKQLMAEMIWALLL